jgi:hypothetical protein
VVLYVCPKDVLCQFNLGISPIATKTVLSHDRNAHRALVEDELFLSFFVFFWGPWRRTEHSMRNTKEIYMHEYALSKMRRKLGLPSTLLLHFPVGAVEFLLARPLRHRKKGQTRAERRGIRNNKKYKPSVAGFFWP